MQYSPEAELSYVNEDVFSTNVDAVHGADTTNITALAAHPNFFRGFTAAADDGDDDENPNDVLLRLLNEVRAVDSDVGGDNGDQSDGIDRSSDENAAGVLFSVTDGSGVKSGFAAPYSGPVHTATGAAGAVINTGGGFTVEGNTSYSSTASMPPPPPPPPPAYGTPSIAPRSPFVNCYSGIPHLTATPITTKLQPPTFAEAIATSHGTPASLPGGWPSPSQERSPMMAKYVPAMPAASQETVLLRNCNGVFLLQPASKPTPPYTPPAGCNSPPVSPVPRYSLPPAAMGGTGSSTTGNTFLGTSVAQVSTRPVTAAAAAGVVEPPHYPPYGAASNSPFITTAAPFVSAVSSVRGTPSFVAAPPPYAGVL